MKGLKACDPKEVDLVFYHSPCLDGFTAAWVVWNSRKDECKYIGMSYNKKNIEPDGVDGKNVLILDYSFSKKVLFDMLKKVKSLTIIDHHKTACQDLEDIPDELKVFDMGKSGCVLTWDYFHKSIKPPLFLLYVQDWDIWTKKMENVTEFHHGLELIPFEFEEYDKIVGKKDKLDELIKNGKIAVKQAECQMERIMWGAMFKKEKLKIKGITKCYTVGYINSNIHISELGNRLVKMPSCDFGVVSCFSYKQNITSFSLRSSDSKEDVSTIAEEFGGGGHRNSSNFKKRGSHLFLSEF